MVAGGGERQRTHLLLAHLLVLARGGHASTGAPIAQLYVTAVAMDEINVYTYPAIYLWNQPANISNHTPAWDIFQIPDVM